MGRPEGDWGRATPSPSGPETSVAICSFAMSSVFGKPRAGSGPHSVPLEVNLAILGRRGAGKSGEWRGARRMRAASSTSSQGLAFPGGWVSPKDFAFCFSFSVAGYHSPLASPLLLFIFSRLPGSSSASVLGACDSCPPQTSLFVFLSVPLLISIPETSSQISSADTNETCWRWSPALGPFEFSGILATP